MPETTPDQNMAVIRRWFEEVWNQKRPSTVHELLSPDCITHGTQESGGDIRGPEAFLEFHARLVDAFPDIHIEVQDCFASGDKVAVRFVVTGHHDGLGLGIAPSGAAVTSPE
jgi:predicted ester cyclase